jgi:ribosomal-protein-alanine N-acetyltransferase
MFRDIHLETDRLLIRPFTAGDLLPLHAILSEEAVVEYLPEATMSLEEVEAILDFVTECYARNTPKAIIKFTVAVVDKASGLLIGWVGLGPLEFETDRVELFYGLNETWWGRGIATEAARAMLHFGFVTLGLPEIVAAVKPENKASVRVLEKLGMEYRSTVRDLPQEQAFYEGHLLYSLRRHEFTGSAASGRPPDAP